MGTAAKAIATRSRVAGGPSHLTTRSLAVVGVAAVLAVDQLSKSIAVDRLLDGAADVPGPFRLRLVANGGALMGFPLPPWLLLVVVVVVAIVAVTAVATTTSRRVALAYALLVGGAAGNLVDRFQHRPRFPDHAVVDWIASSSLPTFNLADVAIVAGVVMLTTVTKTAPVPSARTPSAG
jgi:signal peptidase II